LCASSVYSDLRASSVYFQGITDATTNVPTFAQIAAFGAPSATAQVMVIDFYGDGDTAATGDFPAPPSGPGSNLKNVDFGESRHGDEHNYIMVAYMLLPYG
jgi:hypothetical protein